MAGEIREITEAEAKDLEEIPVWAFMFKFTTKPFGFSPKD